MLVFFHSNQAAFTARVYYMGMLLALNMRGNGGQVMQDGSNSRISGAFGGSNALPLSHIRSTGGTTSNHFHKVIHVSQDIAMHSDKVSFPRLGSLQPTSFERSRE